MNYKRIYDELINRAKNRSLDYYVEKHRIVPGCMGGKYTKSNVVYLTPEEHYLAHQLLVKIYPKHTGLVNAALRMTHGHKGKRNNKVYGWLKRRYVEICKQRIGAKNPNYGNRWINKIGTTENKVIKANESVPAGWQVGRKFKTKTKERSSTQCLGCNDKRKYATGYCKTCQDRNTVIALIQIIEGFLDSSEVTINKYLQKTKMMTQPNFVSKIKRYSTVYNNLSVPKKVMSKDKYKTVLKDLMGL